MVSASALLPRRRPFSRASEEPYRRRLGDAGRLVAAVAVIVWLTHDSAHSSELSLAVFHAINGLPGSLRPLSDLMLDVARLWAVAVVAVAALVGGRWRLARDLLLAGLLAWLVARGLGLVLESGLREGLRATLRSKRSTTFPNVSLAVVVAVVATAAPYLARPTRWVGAVMAGLLVPVEMYLGTALPRSLGCAIAIGLAAAAALHLGFGSPAGRPTAEQVELALHELGVLAAGNVRLAQHQPSEHTLMVADDGDAQLAVKVLGRDERDTQLAVKLTKFLVYKDSGQALYLTRLQEVEHEAYALLLAQNAGIRVAPLVAAGKAGPRTVLLAERLVPGTRLADDPGISDAVLRDVWSQVAQLHHNRIAHGRLNSQHVVIDGEHATLTGFSWARTSATPEQRAADTAELLATTSALVGTDRGVAAALAALGPDALAEALPLLQPGVLSREGRREAGRSRPDLDKHLTEVREAVAKATDRPLPQLEQLRRMSGPGLALTLTFIIAIGSLLSAVGDPRTLGHLLAKAQPWRVVEAAGLAVSSSIGFALALAGSTRRRLPLWGNLKLQIAGSFANISLPLGSQALQIRFLQKHGVTGAEAVAGGGVVNLVGGVAAQVLVFLVAVQASPRSLDVGEIPQGAIITTLEVTVAAVLALSLVVLVVPFLRRRVLPPFERGVRSLVQVLLSPRRIALLLGGSALAYVLGALSLNASIHAFHASLPIAEVIAASTGVALVAALVPLPGGGGAVASVGLSGVLVGLGLPQSTAVAVALLNQVITQYVPVLPGWLSLRSLLKNGEV